MIINRSTALLLFRKVKIALKLLKNGKFRELMSGVIMQKRIMAVKIPEEALQSDSLLLERIDVVVTQRCTLKCKHCSNLMQYFTPQKLTDPSLADLCRDFDLLMRRVDFIRVIEILGGEPLLFKEIPSLLAHMAKYKERIGLIRITTNGTIVPNKAILESAARHKAVFSISDYGDRSVNMAKLKQALRSYKVPFRVVRLAWFECCRIIDGSGRSKEEIAEAYQKCDKACKTLAGGRFYLCPFLAHGEALGAFPKEGRNHVNLLDEAITKADILQYISAAPYLPGCVSCSGGHSFNGKPIPTAEQTKRPLSYKVFEQ